MKKNEKKYKIEKMLILFLLIILMLNIILLIINLQNRYDTFLVDSYIKNVAKNNANNNITKNLVKICSKEKEDFNKIYCVVQKTKELKYFKYEKTKKVLEIDELIRKGGDCKSWAAYYKGILDTMNFFTNIISKNNHSFLNVFGENFYCNIDQKFINCINLID